MFKLNTFEVINDANSQTYGYVRTVCLNIK